MLHLHKHKLTQITFTTSQFCVFAKGLNRFAAVDLVTFNGSHTHTHTHIQNDKKEGIKLHENDAGVSILMLLPCCNKLSLPKAA